MIDDAIGLTVYSFNRLDMPEYVGKVRNVELTDYDSIVLSFPYEQKLELSINELDKMLNEGQIYRKYFFYEKVNPINLIIEGDEKERVKWIERWWEIYFENYKNGSLETIVQDTNDAITRAINGSSRFFKLAGGYKL